MTPRKRLTHEVNFALTIQWSKPIVLQAARAGNNNERAQLVQWVLRKGIVARAFKVARAEETPAQRKWLGKAAQGILEQLPTDGVQIIGFRAIGKTEPNRADVLQLVERLPPAMHKRRRGKDHRGERPCVVIVVQQQRSQPVKVKRKWNLAHQGLRWSTWLPEVKRHLIDTAASSIQVEL